MVDVPVNDNIDDFKVTVFAGLTAVQVISAIISVFAGGLEFLVFNLALGVDMTICSFVILPTVCILVFGINFNRDGLNIIEYVRKGHLQKQRLFLGYLSTETIQNYRLKAEASRGSFEDAERLKEEEFKAMSKKLIFVTLLFVLMMIGGLVAIIFIVL